MTLIVLYHFSVIILVIHTILMYWSENIAKACFSLIVAGILLIIQTIRNNKQTITNYENCTFIASANQERNQNDANDNTSHNAE